MTTEKSQQTIFRKQLIVPAEHGSWPWLLVPYGVGVGVAGQMNLATVLVLVGGLAVFLMRQPATVWLRVRRGRARRANGTLAATWIVLLATAALLALGGLLALGYAMLLWLLLPLAVIFGLYLVAARSGRSGLRSLWMEVTGAAALAVTAPAAGIVAGGQMAAWIWGVWLLMAIQNVLGALYARLRIYDTHQRPLNRAAVLWSHIGGLVVVVAVALASPAVPLAAALPFVGFLARAVWVAKAPRPLQNIKRFGFSEVGVEILSGAWIVAAYVLG